MKNFKSYITLLALGAMSLTACQNDFDDLKVPAPVATIEANTTINEVKTTYWDDATNYIKQIPANEDGSHIIISGRVISSDAAGNIYKSLVIQDETGALAMSINANSMYNKYRMGQEVVIDLTDMYIGKYNGLQQLGFPEEYQDTYEATFMPYEFFEQHAQLNGNPDADKINVITVESFSELSTSPEGLRKWQSQLVRFNNCHFEQGGETTFTDGHKTTSNRTLILSDGNPIIVRTSGYSTFWSDVLPAGNGDVVGILSYFGTSGWQLLLNGRDGCMNFGNPTVGPGAEENPYTVSQAIEVEKEGKAAKGWVKGYIVGAVAPGVQTITSNDDIEFSAEVIMNNTLVIAESADCKNWEECIAFELPQDSKLRQFGNLVDNPGNYGKEIMVSGTLAKFLDSWGITGNRGTASEFKIAGVDIPEDPKPVDGDGTKEKPYLVSQVLTMGNPGTKAWVTGYIVGWVPEAKIADAKFEVPATQAANVLIAADPACKDYNQCVAVQLVFGTEARTAINLVDHPENLGKQVSIEGTLEKYFGVCGLKGSTGYELDGAGGDTPVTPPVTGNGDGTKTNPYTVSQTLSLGNPGTKAWVTGYIVGWVPEAKIADAKFEVPATQAANVLIAADPSCKDYNQCVAVQLVFGTEARTAINLVDHPENLGKKVSIEGTLDKYFGVVGLKGSTGYELDGEGGTTPDTPVTPPTPGTALDITSADLATMNGGKATSYYSKADAPLTSTDGWTAVFCNLLQGGDADNNPVFTFLGSASTFAVTLNGKSGSAGILTSPLIAGGINTLKFKYALPYADTKGKLTINIKQNGSVVASDVLDNGSMEKFKVYEYEHAFNVTGDFTIEIVNDCPSASSSNKDRVAVWDINWTR